MLKFRKARFGIPYDYYWFADRPALRNAARPCVFMQCGSAIDVRGYIRQPFTTKIIDITRPADELLKAMSESTSRKIKRAQKDGVEMRQVDERDRFLRFFNDFSASKGREPLTAQELDGWGVYTLCFAGMRGAEAQVMHTYIADTEKSRARLLHSASHFRNLEDSAERTEVSRANCFLHYQVMLHFKSKGFRELDLGGYAAASPDPELQNIARFKDGFGGYEVHEMSYISYPMALLQKAGQLGRRFRGRSSVLAVDKKLVEAGH